MSILQEREENYRNWLKEKNIDVALLTSSDTVFYFSGFMSDPHERVLAIVLFPEEEPFLFCPQLELETAKATGFPHSVYGYSDTENPWEKIKEEILKRTPSVSTIAIEKQHMTVDRYEALRKIFPDASFIASEEKINELRMIKDRAEIEKLRKACELADEAIRIGCEAIVEGITENELVAIVEYELKKQGVQKMSFQTTILTGPNAANPHGTPGTNKVKNGDFVLFDLGVVYEGYCSDITRTIGVGDVPEEHIQIYNTVLKAQEAAVNACKPGKTCASIDRIARDLISEAGYGEYFTHRLGHGLGINIHEYPSVHMNNELELKEGMVFTIEPGIYIPGKVGVRIEDDVVITKNGVEELTKYPKELQIIPL